MRGDIFKEKSGWTTTLDALSIKALKGGKVLFLRHLISFIINFSGGIVLARFLGPEILGLYFMSYTIFVIFKELIIFGVGVHLIRLPTEPTSVELRTAYTLQQITGFLSLVFGIAIVAPLVVLWYGYRELFMLISSASIGAYFHSWQNIPLSLFEREMDYRKVGIIEVAEFIAFNFIAIFGAIGGFGVLGLSVGNIFRGLAPALIAVLLSGKIPSISRNINNIFFLMRTTAPIIGSSLVVWGIMLAPPVLVGSLAGMMELGIAQLGYSVLTNTLIIATITQRVSLTLLSKFQNDMETFNKIVENLLQMLSMVYIPLTMGIASFSPWWVKIIYGEKWVGLENVVLVAAIPIVASALFSVFLSALFSKGRASIVFKQNICHAIIYWVIMGLSAKYLKAVSVPFSHLIAMSSSYIFIWGYAKYCGKINYKSLVVNFTVGLVTMVFSWYIVSKGNLVVSLLLWTGFLTMWIISSASTRKTIKVFLYNMIWGSN